MKENPVSSIETYIRRAEDDLTRAGALVAKTRDKLSSYCDQSDHARVDRERAEAGLLIQSAAVWARLAGIVQEQGDGAN
jgi:hypothetical protein